MHDKQVFGASLFLISGTGMAWHARNCSCIFEMSAHLLDLLLLLCFVSRLFAFSSFGFVYSVSQSVFEGTAVDHQVSKLLWELGLSSRTPGSKSGQRR
jgi:hypothetical protein